jgi:hypothetical protein
VLGLPITVFCSVVFLVSWALWIGEVRNRRQGGTGGMW